MIRAILTLTILCLAASFVGFSAPREPLHSDGARTIVPSTASSAVALGAPMTSAGTRSGAWSLPPGRTAGEHFGALLLPLRRNIHRQSASGSVTAPATTRPGIEPAAFIPSAPRAHFIPAIESGIASWWDSFGPGLYVALPGYVDGSTVRVRVCAGSRCVVAPVITQCGCPNHRIADLSLGILLALGLDLSRGIYVVTLQENR